MIFTYFMLLEKTNMVDNNALENAHPEDKKERQALLPLVQLEGEDSSIKRGGL